MRNLMLIAGALLALACTSAFAADVDDPAYGTLQPALDNAAATGVWASETAPPPAMRVMGLLTKDQLAAMRATHVQLGLDIPLTVVPAGGINAGKYYVTGTLTPELMAQMEAAHEDNNLRLDLRAMPVWPDGVVLGDTRTRAMADDDEDDMDDDAYGDDDDDMDDDDYAERDARHESNAHTQWMQAPAGMLPPGHPRVALGEAPPPGHPPIPGMWQGERWRGHHGIRGWRGGQGPNYDIRDHCGHWEQDWQQDGCGSVHVHNLADWLPNHVGWSYGWPYGGWDDDFWPYIRNDGSQVWYTGKFWRTANIVATPPAWFDAQWTMFGDAYPDTWWLSTWQGHGWNWRGHGAWGASCGCGGRCGGGRCGGSKCGCGCHRGWR